MEPVVTPVRRRSPNQDVIGHLAQDGQANAVTDDEFFSQVALELFQLSPTEIQRDLHFSNGTERKEMSSDTTTAKATTASTSKDTCAAKKNSKTRHKHSKSLCAICLEPVDDSTKTKAQPLVVRTNCQHEFHLNCLKENRKFSRNCPMCRQQLARGLTPERINSTTSIVNSNSPSSPNADNTENVDNSEAHLVQQVSSIMDQINQGNFPDF